VIQTVAQTVAEWLVGVAGLYLAAGVVFALPFLLSGVGKIDRVAAQGTVGFRLIILPGVVALWPLLAIRWLRATGSPPEETNPHRTAAARRAAAGRDGREARP
jgi:hypothetical protein